jgi:hypothetical protein
MSAREQWQPTPAERAEHDARHVQALADHKAAHPEWYEELLQ